MAQKKQRLLQFAYMAFVALMPLGYFYLLWKLFTTGKLLYSVRPQRLTFVDFVSLYRCGQMALLGPHTNIYNSVIQLSAYNQVISPLSVTMAPYAEYVPWTFLSMMPFAALPLPLAYFLWNVSTVSFGLFGLDQLLRSSNAFGTKQRIFFLLGTLSFYPSLICILQGQNSWLLLGALALYTKFIQGRKDVPAALTLLVLSFKPQYMLFLLIPPLALKRWRLLAFTAAGMMVILAICAAYFGAVQIIAYPGTLAHATLTSPTVFPNWMVSFRAPLSMVLNHTLAFRISMLIWFASLAAVYWLWSKASKRTEPLVIAISCIGMLVTSPNIQVHDLALLSVPCALLVAWIEKEVNHASSSLARWTLNFIISLPLIGFLLFLLLDVLPIHEVLSLCLFVVQLLLLYWSARLFAANFKMLPES